MAPKGIITITATTLFLLAMVSTRATAQSGCTSVLIGMASCLNYVSGGATAPPTSCCSALANVVRTQPRCLCIIANGDGGAALGVSINRTAALGLPSVCQLVTPPASRCNGVNGPAMSPVGSPESPPPESGIGFHGSPASPSVTGSKTGPSENATSHGSMAPATNFCYLFLLLSLIFVSNSYAT